jgi:membrane-anchored protein YejM (alkaline phosphatase superfamily)
MQSIGTFQLRMLGFKKQPVDHYMRTFYVEAEKYYSRFRRFCIGSLTRHENLFNWIKEFFAAYENQPKFSFIFHSETSHNFNNPLSLIDEDLKKFLISFKETGIFENTILLLMSDHGIRVSDLRQFSQGKLEEVSFFRGLSAER